MDLQSYKAAVVLAIYEYQMLCVIPVNYLFLMKHTFFLIKEILGHLIYLIQIDIFI